MIRRLMGRLLGFRGEIECLQARVTELSWDETFGMLTRNAFLQYCAELPPGGRSIIFLDLSDIGNLNNLYGFAEVDRRVRSIFASLEIPGVTIARWYSGDEIVLLFDGSQDPKKWITKLHWTAQRVGISFVYEAGLWEVAEGTVEEVVNELSAKSCLHKITAKEIMYSGENYAFNQKEAG